MILAVVYGSSNCNMHSAANREFVLVLCCCSTETTSAVLLFIEGFCEAYMEKMRAILKLAGHCHSINVFISMSVTLTHIFLDYFLCTLHILKS